MALLILSIDSICVTRIFAAIFSWNGNLYLPDTACAQGNEE
jgi:hypothetical protein